MLRNPVTLNVILTRQQAGKAVIQLKIAILIGLHYCYRQIDLLTYRYLLCRAAREGHRMKHPRVTLQDIAQLAGVTKMTVSRFLRTLEKVAADTAERIAQVMRELNVTDADTAQAGRRPRIGVLIPPSTTRSSPTCWPASNRYPSAGLPNAGGELRLQPAAGRRADRTAVELPDRRADPHRPAHTLRAETYLGAPKSLAQVMDLDAPPGRIAVGLIMNRRGMT